MSEPRTAPSPGLSGSDAEGPSTGGEPAQPSGRARSKVAPFVALGIAAVFGVLVFVFAGSSPRAETADTPLMDEPAPAVSGLLAPADPDAEPTGAQWRLDREKGNWVVLNFFDSTCVPCVQEHPELVQFAADQAELRGGAKLVTVIYESREGGSAASVQWLRENGADWPVVTDNGSTANAFAVSKVPETWIIDPNGVVRWRTISTVTAEQLNGLLSTPPGTAATAAAPETTA